MKKSEYNVPHTQVRGEPMPSPEDVAAMLRLKACGWGTKRIADELGISRNTVKRYLRQGGWAPYASPQRSKSLEGLEEWLEARFLQHAGNAAVVLQDLQLEHGLTVQPAHGGARLRALASGTGRRSQGHGKVRDATRQAAADRLRQPPHHHRWGVGQSLPVCRHPGILPTPLCPRLPARAAIGMVRRPGRRLPSLWRGTGAGAAG